MFENLTLGHLLVVVVIALLLFGPKRIPEVAGSMGKGIREFKKSIREVGSDDRTVMSQPVDASQPDSDRAEPKRLM